jgi:hypothetical protein
VRRRAGETCEFPGCFYAAFTNFSHRRPHSDHGSREKRNLMLLCGEHHFLQEVGFIKPVGPTPNLLWFLPDDSIISKERPGGYEPETDRERRALEALRARERKSRDQCPRGQSPVVVDGEP